MNRESLRQGSYAKKLLFEGPWFLRWAHQGRFETGRKLVQPYAGGKILDYGCGDGTFLAMVQDRFDQLMGVDLEPSHIKQCKSRFADYENMQFCLSQVFEQESSEKFDVICCMEVLEHCLEKEQKRILKLFSTRVSSKGRVLISVPVEIGHVLALKQIGRWLIGVAGNEQYKHAEKYELNEFWKMITADKNTGIDRPVYSRGASKDEQDSHHGHKGFNWKNFQTLIEQHFKIEKIEFSPLNTPQGILASQVWFKCGVLG